MHKEHPRREAGEFNSFPRLPWEGCSHPVLHFLSDRARTAIPFHPRRRARAVASFPPPAGEEGGEKMDLAQWLELKKKEAELHKKLVLKKIGLERKKEAEMRRLFWLVILPWALAWGYFSLVRRIFER